MKIFKGIIAGIGVIILILILVAGVAILLDEKNTAYLEIEDNPAFATNSYLIKNVNVVPMTDDTVLFNQMVLIQEGVITEIAEQVAESKAAIIDAGGSFLSPGLIDMHVHVWDEFELGLYLANGVTTVRNLWGQPMHLRMKEAINNEEIIGPVFFTSGPKLTGPEFIGDDNLQLFTPEEAYAKVAEYKERGYDFIKTYYGLTGELFDAVIEKSGELKFDIVAHPTPKVPYSYHFKPEIVTIEHAEDIVQLPLEYRLDSARLDEVVDLYASHPNTKLCPTLVVYHNIYRLLTEDNILQSEALKNMNPLIRAVDSQAQFDRWAGTKSSDSTIVSRIKDQHDFHLLAIRKLHERQVKIVAGTDAGIGVTPPGYSLHEELNFYTQAGMSNYQALQTATINPSETHDFLSNQGSIEIGKLANFILTKDNPLDRLEVLRNPQMVMVRGRMIKQEMLDEFKQKARNRSNLLASALRYAENLIVEK
ncbi:MULTISPECIES: amidohydrolase family protein [unclassified Imperialibacter]|uniref:amidohydrolase family protein n=1 Tax=unclassified Imperialibacter TaxID=2629706 RepID=UPI0012575B28|nr:MULTISPECIES: amidohydrolase family protein [unclassified Imperialibacter]CAD5249407.1 Amidohydrolase [Imperialibacter sp. 89]CAD5264498.1 Amidohydrolase [Imperialibacter sp. 75]VVT06830.1 Amidohydrolase [Imperialibacter sp. EC-SDR9]